MTRKYVIPTGSGIEDSNTVNSSKPKNVFAPFFRSSLSAYPATPEGNRSNAPIGLSINPSMIDNVPKIDYRNKYLVRCNFCHGYLSPNCHIIPERKAWICSLCGKSTSLPKNYDIENGIETHNHVYDLITTDGRTQSKSDQNQFSKVIAISIDTTNIKFCQIFIESLKIALNNIKDDSIVICLFSFDQNVTYYDPQRKKSIVISEFDDIQLPPFQFLPLSETKDFLIKSLDLLAANSRGKSPGVSTSFRNLLNLVNFFLKDSGGLFIMSLFDFPDDIRAITKDNPFVIPENQNEVLDLGFKLNSNSISVHIFHQFDNSIKINSFVSDCIAGLTCGSSYVCDLDLHSEDLSETKKYHNFLVHSKVDEKRALLDAELNKILTNKYCWRSLGVLRTNPSILDITYLGNCVIRQNGVCTFGAYPTNASMSYILNMPKIFTFDTSTIGLQFAFMFSDDFGNRITRVISFSINKNSIVDESYVDKMVTTTLIAKNAVKLFRDSDFNAASTYITSNNQNIYGNFFRTPLFGNSDACGLHTIADSVFIIGATVNETMLYFTPREVQRKNAVWRQTNKAIYIFPNSENKNDGVDEEEEKAFSEFCEECKSFIGYEQPNILYE